MNRETRAIRRLRRWLTEEKRATRAAADIPVTRIRDGLAYRAIALSDVQMMLRKFLEEPSDEG